MTRRIELIGRNNADTRPMSPWQRDRMDGPLLPLELPRRVGAALNPSELSRQSKAKEWAGVMIGVPVIVGALAIVWGAA